MTRPRLSVFALVFSVAAPTLAAGAPDGATVETLTQLVAVAASNMEGTEVLSSKDVQDIVSLEADKQLAGCEDTGACLAEVAGALGARLVVFGHLGRLDDVLVLTLNLFDADSASSAGRSVVRATSVSELGDKAEHAVQELVARGLSRIAPAAGEPDRGGRVRVLVMDLRVAGGPGVVAAQEPPPEPPVPWLAVGGGGLAVAGVVALSVGLVAGSLTSRLDEEVRQPETLQKDVPGLVEQRDAGVVVTNVLLIGGGVAAVVGGGLLALGLLGGE